MAGVGLQPCHLMALQLICMAYKWPVIELSIARMSETTERRKLIGAAGATQTDIVG